MSDSCTYDPLRNIIHIISTGNHNLKIFIGKHYTVHAVHVNLVYRKETIKHLSLFAAVPLCIFVLLVCKETSQIYKILRKKKNTTQDIINKVLSTYLFYG